MYSVNKTNFSIAGVTIPSLEGTEPGSTQKLASDEQILPEFPNQFASSASGAS